MWVWHTAHLAAWFWVSPATGDDAALLCQTQEATTMPQARQAAERALAEHLGAASPPEGIWRLRRGQAGRRGDAITWRVCLPRQQAADLAVAQARKASARAERSLTIAQRARATPRQAARQALFAADAAMEATALFDAAERLDPPQKPADAVAPAAKMTAERARAVLASACDHLRVGLAIEGDAAKPAAAEASRAIGRFRLGVLSAQQMAAGLQADAVLTVRPGSPGPVSDAWQVVISALGQPDLIQRASTAACTPPSQASQAPQAFGEAALPCLDAAVTQLIQRWLRRA